VKITIEQYPLTYSAFAKWFEREGWGADDIDELSEAGWDTWFPDFLRDWKCDSAAEVESILASH
jgi:hypothetical protein